MEFNLKNLLTIAKQASKESEHFLSSLDRNKMVVNSDIGKDIKLDADIESEKIIIEYIKKKSYFPILSEELNPNKNYKEQKNIWIIDPLDGSLNFSRGIYNYCISIALWSRGKPVLGVINDFSHKNIFEGIVGEYAACNEKKIHVSNICEKKKSILLTGFPVNANFSESSLFSFIKNIRDYKKIRLLGSAALSLSYLAAGKAEVYLENDIMIYDVAAGIAIVQAAGGTCRYFDGTVKNSLKLLATNSKV